MRASPEVHPFVVDALRREATAIWAEEGVVLGWPDDATAALTLLVVRHGTASPAADQPGTVGQIHGLGGLRPTAIVSLRSAEAVLEDAARRRGDVNLPLNPQRRRAGLVFGRAAAHEFGHFLLGRADHDATD